MDFRGMRSDETREGRYVGAYRRFLTTVLSVAVGAYVVYQHLLSPALPAFPVAETVDVSPARSSPLPSRSPAGTGRL